MAALEVIKSNVISGITVIKYGIQKDNIATISTIDHMQLFRPLDAKREV